LQYRKLKNSCTGILPV